jgi:peptidoglycan/xylan/chitin deacetylase (PgdA/CDA1 family)
MLSSTRHGRLSLGKTLSGLRTLARLAYVTLLFCFGAFRRARRELSERGAIVILTFHRVLDDDSNQKSSSLPGIVIREETFRKLAKYLVQHCDPVHLDGVVPGGESSKLRVAITFDDGWRDNYSTALPIAKGFGLPFTVFICPGLVGQNNPFWPEQVSALLSIRGESPTTIEEVIEKLKHGSATDRNAYLESLRKTSSQNYTSASEIEQLLSWDEIRSMRAAGVSFGSHTQTHQILTTIPKQFAALELSQSKSAIETEFGEPCTIFAYPNGDCSSETRQWVADAGYKRALTTTKGAWTAECDRLSLPRLNVSEGNVTGLFGQFSPMMFEYTTFWWAWRALSKSKIDLAGTRFINSGDTSTGRQDINARDALHPVKVQRAQAS